MTSPPSRNLRLSPISFHNETDHAWVPLRQGRHIRILDIDALQAKRCEARPGDHSVAEPVIGRSVPGLGVFIQDQGVEAGEFGDPFEAEVLDVGGWEGGEPVVEDLEAVFLLFGEASAARGRDGTSIIAA